MKSNHDHWLFNISISQILLVGLISKYEIKCQIVKTFKSCHLNEAYLLINNISYLKWFFVYVYNMKPFFWRKFLSKICSCMQSYFKTSSMERSTFLLWARVRQYAPRWLGRKMLLIGVWRWACQHVNNSFSWQSDTRVKHTKILKICLVEFFLIHIT